MKKKSTQNMSMEELRNFLSPKHKERIDRERIEAVRKMLSKSKAFKAIK